jgi:hypothetical protein
MLKIVPWLLLVDLRNSVTTTGSGVTHTGSDIRNMHKVILCWFCISCQPLEWCLFQWFLQLEITMLLVSNDGRGHSLGLVCLEYKSCLILGCLIAGRAKSEWNGSNSYLLVWGMHNACQGLSLITFAWQKSGFTLMLSIKDVEQGMVLELKPRSTQPNVCGPG